MIKDSRSFFERLTGAVRMPEEDPLMEDKQEPTKPEYDRHNDYRRENSRYHDNSWDQAENEEAEEEEDFSEGTLSVDMYETPNELIIKTVVAGSRPEDLDISITRERVSIQGKRNPDRLIKDSETHLQELYWGKFSRVLSLPVEIEADEAEATSLHGLLEIKLPKTNRDKETKLKVKPR